MRLKINLRVHLGIGNEDGEFATQLPNVGNGLLDQDSHNQIQLPFLTIRTDELITRVFPDVHIQHSNNDIYQPLRKVNFKQSLTGLNSEFTFS